jgi:hypothetical protein
LKQLEEEIEKERVKLAQLEQDHIDDIQSFRSYQEIKKE